MKCRRALDVKAPVGAKPMNRFRSTSLVRQEPDTRNRVTLRKAFTICGSEMTPAISLQTYPLLGS